MINSTFYYCWEKTTKHMCLHGPRSRLIQYAHYFHYVTAELLRAGDCMMTRLRALESDFKMAGLWTGTLFFLLLPCIWDRFGPLFLLCCELDLKMNRGLLSGTSVFYCGQFWSKELFRSPSENNTRCFMLSFFLSWSFIGHFLSSRPRQSWERSIQRMENELFSRWFSRERVCISIKQKNLKSSVEV